MNRETKTAKVELVETENIYLSIKRLNECGPHDFLKWRRALYHAACMYGVGNEVQRKLREALELP
jgi:hypothetical protein